MVVASATVLMTIWFIFQGWRMDTGKAVASSHEMKAAVLRDQVVRKKCRG